ncbi:unnamed protein product [Calicophoron daubneyi]|uniref:Uncharacterized protein n=1 Tax=Calicophoron daubneyi TaxID=300641 RepID=A0AAV2SY34_CALDB
MGKRGKPKKLSTNQKKYKEVVKARITTKTPPVQYTRRLKSRKQKKLKVIGSNTHEHSGRVNNPPRGDDLEYMPSSFREVFCRKAIDKRSRLRPGIGDTTGMKKKDTINKLPKQGKHEPDKVYLERVNKEVEDELAKLKFAKTQKTQLITEGSVKSKKKRKSLKRLSEKRRTKRLYNLDKRKTGFEHLRDEVKFNEVVQAPPINLPRPRKIGGAKKSTVHALDKLLST